MPLRFKVAAIKHRSGRVSMLLLRHLRFASYVAMGIIVGPLKSTNAITYRTVALSGNRAPGTDQAVFGPSAGSEPTFGIPALNNHGQVAFWATLTRSQISYDYGIFAENGDDLQLRLVARAESTAPGTDVGPMFSSLSDPLFNDAGHTLIRGTYDGQSRSGLWSEQNGTLNVKARLGLAAPGTESGVIFGNVFGFNPVFNDAGASAFRAFLAGPGVTSQNYGSIWSEAGGSLHMVARTGSAAPGTSIGVTFRSTSFLPGFNEPALNNAGQTAFSALLSGPSVNSTNDFGIWSEGANGLGLVARTGSNAPGTATGVNFRSFFGPTLNNSGDVAFQAELTGPGVDNTNNSGIWTGSGGNLQLVARTGVQAPGTEADLRFGGFGYQAPGSSDPVFNNQGNVAFAASLSGPGVNSTNDIGIWSNAGGSLHLVMRIGLPAPGTGSGVNFAALNSFNSSAGLGHALNELGQTAFSAFLAGVGVDESNDFGIWVETPNGIVLIAREGQMLEVAPGDWRTIADGGPGYPPLLAFADSSGNADGRRSGFNDRGQLAFRTYFTDGSSGIFVADVGVIPEPSWAILAVLATGFLLVTRRRTYTSVRVL
jgi:hypothetical protein